MAHFVGLDVSVKETSVCVVDDAGKVILEQKVSTEPADIIALLTSLGVTYGRIGIEAGPRSQWPRTRRGFSSAGRDHGAAARRPPGDAPAARRPAQDAARHGPRRPGVPTADDRPRGRRGGCADLPCDGRPAATVRPFPGGRRACRPDAEALPIWRDRL